MSGKDGTYSFVDTRNNNYSNRSQKLKIAVGLSPTKRGTLAGALAAAFGGDENAATATVVIFIIVAVVVVVLLLAVAAVVGVFMCVIPLRPGRSAPRSSGALDRGVGAFPRIFTGRDATRRAARRRARSLSLSAALTAGVALPLFLHIYFIYH